MSGTRAERSAAGRELRKRVPRASHAQWKRADKDRDSVEILQKDCSGRLENLVPIRYGRMVHTPFTFLRGSAAVMARDLAQTLNSGLHVQLCGDCHLLNFGLFATPERRLVFDLNDFDETLPGPWEWDLKRLAVSFVIAARDNGLTEAQSRDAALTCVATYRKRMHESAEMTPMQVWYAHLDWEELIASSHDPKFKQRAEELATEARHRIVEHTFPKIAKADRGHFRLTDQPRLVFHVTEADAEEWITDAVKQYERSLPRDRCVLFERYHLEDSAFKVVGVGSVGTRCLIVLFVSGDGEPLILQFKQAVRSVLESYLQKTRYDNQGERVVMGQRLMQSSSDIFLGWARGTDGNDFYVRQMRDMKMSMPLEKVSTGQLERYARLCGSALAHSHARSGDSAAISGYLGRGDRFDRAVAKFAVTYADQTERDHAALVKAVRSGRVEALAEQ